MKFGGNGPLKFGLELSRRVLQCNTLISPMSGDFFDQASGGLIDFVLLGVCDGQKTHRLG